MRMKFRRATHDKDGNYKKEMSNENCTSFQKQVWNAHGGVCHMLDSAKALEFEEILEEIRKDFTNYLYNPLDLDGWLDGEAMPTPAEVAVSLVRLLEAGFVEMEASHE